MKAVLLISHGSQLAETKEEVRELLRQLKEKNKQFLWEFAFLEIESPNIPDGIKKCIDDGATEVTVLLNFLNSGKHVNEDIPRIIDKARMRYKDVKFQITSPIGQHPQVVDLFLQMIC